jgi:hypothetical protein
VVPFTQLVGDPIPAENLAAGIDVPPSVQRIIGYRNNEG